MEWLREGWLDTLALTEDWLRTEGQEFMIEKLYSKAIEVVGKYVRVSRGAYTNMAGEIIEVGARDGGLYHGCVKIRFDRIHPEWSSNEQWFLSGYLSEAVRERSI